MKTNIYYFTSTGNSLAVAKDIGAQIGEAKLVPIAKAIKEDLDLSADAIGIIFPVYMWGAPLIVVDFLKKFKDIKNKYIFSVVTYGGFPGYTLCQVKDQLAKQGTKLSAGWGIRMPGNYTPMYGALPPKKQNKCFEKAKIKITSIVKKIISQATAKPEHNFFLIDLLFSKLLYPMGISSLKIGDKNFFADEKCNGCGICAKVCPVNNIVMENNKPVWQHQCQQCLGCLQWCPKEAIQFGKSTKNRKRYHHPEITLREILN